MDELIWKAAHEKLLRRVDALEEEVKTLREILDAYKNSDPKKTVDGWPKGAPYTESMEDDGSWYTGGEDWYGEQDDDD